MRTSQRYQLRLAQTLQTDVESFAELRGLSRVSAIRVLLRLGLEAASQPTNKGVASAATLACLTAAEHAVLMVASILPEGQRRMYELAPQAAHAAEQRLALFEEPGE